MKKLCFSVLALSTLVVGCNQPTTSNEAQPARNAAQAAKIYPHSESFKTKEHGGFYVQSPELCLKCHNGAAPDSKATTCTTCHADFPHPEGWALPTNHGAKFLASSKNECATCHKPGGATNVSCSTCHADFPHPPGWAVPGNHGAKYAQLDDSKRKYCLACHKQGSSTAAACQTCHQAFPHSEDFKSGGDNHAALAQTYDGKCTICHTDYKRNMPNMGDAGCTTCHEGKIKIHWLKDGTPTAAHAPGKKSFAKGDEKKTSRKPSSRK